MGVLGRPKLRMLLFDGLFTDYFYFGIILANVVRGFIPLYTATVYQFREPYNITWHHGTVF